MGVHLSSNNLAGNSAVTQNAATGPFVSTGHTVCGFKTAISVLASTLSTVSLHSIRTSNLPQELLDRGCRYRTLSWNKSEGHALLGGRQLRQSKIFPSFL